MRQLFAALFLVSLMALPAAAQTFCAQLGAFTDCSGSNGRSSTQVDLGNNQGVIITDQGTEPYTILRPAQPSMGVPSVPSVPSVPTVQLAEPMEFEPILMPTMDGMPGMIMLGGQ